MTKSTNKPVEKTKPKRRAKRQRPSVVYWYSIRYYLDEGLSAIRKGPIRKTSATFNRKRSNKNVADLAVKAFADANNKIKVVSVTCKRTTIIVRTHQP